MLSLQRKQLKNIANLIMKISTQQNKYLPLQITLNQTFDILTSFNGISIGCSSKLAFTYVYKKQNKLTYKSIAI